MAIKPSPDRSDLESKTREDLQTIAKVKGVDAPTRATKAALIEAIMGDPPSSDNSTSPDGASASASNGTRAVRSRRTVATPEDDFEDLLGEFVAEPKSETVPPSEPALSEAVAPSERPSARQFTQTRPERQPREFTNDSNNRSRRNRRNRNGRERFSGDSMPNADQPYAGELVDVEGLLDLRDDGYGFLRTKGYHSSPNDVYVSTNQVRRHHRRRLPTGCFE
jgi:transcription termination factor Rho